MASVHAEYFFSCQATVFFVQATRVATAKVLGELLGSRDTVMGALAAPKSRLKPALSMGLMAARFGGAIRAGRAVSSARNR
jgi:ethanolamine ammonia-lyase small subunit